MSRSFVTLLMVGATVVPTVMLVNRTEGKQA